MPKGTEASRSLPAVSPMSVSLSGEWRFTVDPDGVGKGAGWFEPGFDDSEWATVTVPHSWNVMGEHADYEGLAWYRRSLTLPPEAEIAHLRLRFDAVFYLAHVWVNGEYVGSHEGGYTPFAFDVSKLAGPGEENIVAVQVDNVRATDRIPALLYEGRSYGWGNYGGVVREVPLDTTSRVFIARQQVVAVPHLTGVDEADTATITATGDPVIPYSKVLEQCRVHSAIACSRPVASSTP